MAAIVLGDVMDAIAATLLSGNVTKRAYAWPEEAVAVPCAVVGDPESIDFDATYGRGSDKATFPVWFLVGLVTGRASRDALSDIITGAAAVKNVLDGTLGGVVQTARVTDCQPDVVTVGGVSHLAGRFDVEVYS